MKKLEDYIYYEEKNPDLKIYHGDCFEIMALLDKVDLVVTDPPYGVDFKKQGWDKEIPNWLPTAKQVSEKIVFTTAPTTQWDYPRPDWVSCFYRPASSSRNFKGGFNHWSPILVYGQIKFEVDSINLHAIANATQEWVDHPSPKPLKLMKWLCSLNEGTILDPFLGSGTTLVACKELKRNGIGIEINEKYCEIAKKRLINTQRMMI